jgi:hypothetical protein
MKKLEGKVALVTPDARWVTGQVLDTTGGLAP